MALSIDKQSTLSSLFAARVAATPQAPAYRYYRDGVWHDWNWREAAAEVARWQSAFMREGLARGERVALSARNRAEWMCFDQAALSLGLIVVPLYYNDRPDNMAWCLNDAGAKLLMIEDPALWTELKTQVTTVTRVVSLAAVNTAEPDVIAAAQWLPARAEFLANPVAIQADDLATVVYTSGTTGRPKGVMLTHRNIVADLEALMKAVPVLLAGGQQFLSFLPLSHMFERTVGYYIPICLNAQVIYARGIPELAEDLASQKPHIIVSVPRIFERVYAKIDAGLAPGSTKRRLFEKTVDIGWKRFTRSASVGENLLWPLLNALVARKLRARLGGRLQYIMLGGAALAPHLLKTFTAMGFTFIHGYGLTETSPVLSCNRVEDNDPLSVGKPLPGVEVRVAEHGELWVRGPIIMRGYWNNPAATQAMIDSEGWLHTGDVVEMRNEKIYIRGRVKDVIVLSNGEKLAPGDVEQAVLQDTAFEQVMVIGEGRPALALIAVTALTDEREICLRANNQLHAFPGYVKLRHVVRATEPWTVENGMMTATLKLKRNKIEEAYARAIEGAYQKRVNDNA